MQKIAAKIRFPLDFHIRIFYNLIYMKIKIETIDLQGLKLIPKVISCFLTWSSKYFKSYKNLEGGI